MGRGERFVSLLVVIGLLSVWYKFGPQFKTAWVQVNKAKGKA